MTIRPVELRNFCFGASLFLALWALGTFLWHVEGMTGPYISLLFFLAQDLPVLCVAALGVSLIPFLAPPADPSRHACKPVYLALAVALIILIAWAGHYCVFEDYALSRDEEMAQFAGTYLRHGRLGMPIPAEWEACRRAMVPIFTSPFGGDKAWISIYLPINSAIRGLISQVADPNLATPLLLGVGLLSLWSAARRLFADRPDALLVTMLMAFSSTQLLATAMTPYAMTGHFALNMAWLALLLRDDWKGHVAAALVAFLAVGLHQPQFTPLFLAPFLFWLLLRRRWAPLLFHGVVLLAILYFWMKAYPGILSETYGALPLTPQGRGSAHEKVSGLLNRFSVLQPLFSLARFAAWNNALLLPLAFLGLWRLRWRSAIRGEDVVLPLALACLLGLGLMIDQKMGWGYRYFHGLIGPFCLLAGFGWMRLTGSPARLSLRPVWLSCGLAAFTGMFLLWQAHAWVAPYARAYRALRASDAQVVIVDWRGGLFGQDLIRFDDGTLRKPVLMDINFLSRENVDTLCARYDVAIFDKADFWPMGMPQVGTHYNGSDYVQSLRDQMAAMGCGRRIGLNPPAR